MLNKSKNEQVLCHPETCLPVYLPDGRQASWREAGWQVAKNIIPAQAGIHFLYVLDPHLNGDAVMDPRFP